MRIRLNESIIFVVISVVTILSCSHYDELERNGKESKHGAAESHNFMQDCMSCHNERGNEAAFIGGWWNIAGSSYAEDGSLPGKKGFVELWSQPNRTGTKYATFEMDDLGNFYSEKIIDYNGNCFPVLVSESGSFVSMSSTFRGGGCNGCHNNSVAPRLQIPS